MAGNRREFNLKNIKEQGAVVVALLEDLAGLEVPADTVNDIRLAMVEGINNAFIHGARSVDGQVTIFWEIDGSSLRFEIADKGNGFDYRPEKFHERDEGNLLCEGGMGIFLIQQVMDEIFYNEKGNVLCGLKTW